MDKLKEILNTLLGKILTGRGLLIVFALAAVIASMIFGFDLNAILDAVIKTAQKLGEVADQLGGLLDEPVPVIPPVEPPPVIVAPQ